MKRRQFIAWIGGGLAAWPLAARGQPSMPVVGFLGSTSPESFGRLVEAFRNGLGQTGYSEGRNVAIEYRWAENRYERLQPMASELVRRPVAVIVASGGAVAPIAAKAATSTIPIVFTAMPDPVKAGLVASLNRPGGNMTGTAALTAELDAKRLEILRELVPGGGLIGAFVNPNRPDAEAQARDMQDAARTLGQQVTVFKAGSAAEIDAAFAEMARQRIAALLIGSDPFFTGQHAQMVALTTRHGVPAIYAAREFPDAGGLASYGSRISDGYRQAGIYTGRILKGEKPADLPVVQPTKIELIINLKAAKTLGLDVPTQLVARADEVIE
jgi:putative ABC transport system substrate-binding protein